MSVGWRVGTWAMLDGSWGRPHEKLGNYVMHGVGLVQNMIFGVNLYVYVGVKTHANGVVNIPSTCSPQVALLRCRSAMRWSI
jgi:hypothetical protein